MIQPPTPAPTGDAEAHAFLPAAQGLAGDAASPAAIRRLSHALAKPAAKAQRKAVEKLKAALAAARAHDFHRGAQRALDALAIDERNGLAWHVLAICQEKTGHFAQALNAYEAALQLLPNCGWRCRRDQQLTRVEEPASPARTAGIPSHAGIQPGRPPSCTPEATFANLCSS